MGKTAFSGPVYGAKANLWTYGPFQDTHSTGASTAILNANAIRVVPNYEDWFITEVQHVTSTNSSVANTHGVYVKSEGGSTTGIVRADGNVSTVTQTIYSAANPAGSTTWNTSTVVTATPGEYEGKWVPAGSTIRIVSSGVSVMGITQVNLMGYIRYVNSTRGV
jgi:hypothetical protein